LGSAQQYLTLNRFDVTVAVFLAGLFPIIRETGTGSEVMQRIAAPMVRG